MTHSDAMKAIRQAATTADLSEVIDAYLGALGEDPADSASETFEETAARFHDAGNMDAYVPAHGAGSAACADPVDGFFSLDKTDCAWFTP